VLRLKRFSSTLDYTLQGRAKSKKLLFRRFANVPIRRKSAHHAPGRFALRCNNEKNAPLRGKVLDTWRYMMQNERK
jgi:hypothetical protein